MSGSKRSFFVGLLFLACLSLLVAQGTRSRIYGKVTDADGVPLRDVLVTAVNCDSGAKIERHSDKKGAFRFVAVQPGPYQVSFEKEGYKPHSIMCVMNVEQSVGLKPKLKKVDAAN